MANFTEQIVALVTPEMRDQIEARARDDERSLGSTVRRLLVAALEDPSA